MDAFASIIIAALALGGPFAWATLLNLRDRREARLLNKVLGELSTRDLRGRVAVQVRSGILSTPAVVKIHLLSASPQEIWELLGRLSERVSPRVRLEVTGPVERPLAATFTFVPCPVGNMT